MVPRFTAVHCSVSQGKLDKALPLLEESLVIRKKVFGDEHLKVAIALNNIAQLYQDQVW